VSNAVILRLLEPMLNSVLSDMFRSEILHENHPLVSFLEQRLSRMWALSGGLRCPELERTLTELQTRSPEKLRDLIKQMTKEYYEKLKSPYPEFPKPSWVTKRKKEVVEAVV